MKTDKELKEIVQQKYSQIVLQDQENNLSSCCGSGSRSTEGYNIMADDYTKLDGYNADADLGLGCGLPTEFAKIKKGDTVIDLGSGAGNDCFIARRLTGEEGKVIGIDFTPAMIEKARLNVGKMKFDNVEFRQGDIEQMPVASKEADVIVSNCVLNLVPNKEGVFKEIFRVLKPGGHFSISDIVLSGHLPGALLKDAEMYSACISGAIKKEEYLGLIMAIGFTDITIQKEKQIMLPANMLVNYMNDRELADFNASDSGIFSITVFAKRPLQENKDSSDTGCGN